MTTRERTAQLKPVPCPSCGHDMPAGRASASLLPVTGGTCTDCTADARMARPPAPMYETEAWARGIKL